MAISTSSVLSAYTRPTLFLSPSFTSDTEKRSGKPTKMRREKSVPYAWYWEGRPLRGNQIRPVYTGPASCSSSTLASCCPDYSSAETVQPCSTSTSKAHECPNHQHVESDCCSSETCCESAEAETDPCCCSLCCDSDHTTTSSETSTCTQPSECPSSSSSSASTCSTASSTPSTIHYHTHAYFRYPNDNCPSQSSYISNLSCTCTSCQTYYYPLAPGSTPAPATRTTKHQCPDFPPPSQVRPKMGRKTDTDTCYQYHPSNYYPHYPHYPRTKVRAHFEEPCEDASSTATISSECMDSVHGNCEAYECCGSAWRYRDHPAFRKRC
ncbi:uncharacterized protein EURHEDRAFT_410042 [Aspergillus ruber CBS 135680]|uniref:Uncharacterized protein n=1 Tax=Aspergillus ruber (strain CBS 135680) TaxID=1388766 RepID=A0A017SLY8_ASPRC|nr:uncharacterized protein EURHEDRAFT_410042 [Aspergillus ruber CBS 135680]EYE97796.1 hypothetical protein EURHEDRAFT_410042 [Aspergillus ruber CBS 135680]